MAYSQFLNMPATLYLKISQDARILAWKFSVAGNLFEPSASLSGHRLGVVSLAIGSMKLYSGSMDNTIKVRALKLKLP